MESSKKLKYDVILCPDIGNLFLVNKVLHTIWRHERYHL
jgi:hypothetical protein